MHLTTLDECATLAAAFGYPIPLNLPIKAVAGCFVTLGGGGKSVVYFVAKHSNNVVAAGRQYFCCQGTVLSSPWQPTPLSNHPLATTP
jgi:hypothetical protein